MSKSTIPSLVRIDWLDSSSTHNWVPLAEAPQVSLLCHSVGYLVAESPESVTISAVVGVDDSGEWTCADPLTIPTVSVVKKRRFHDPFIHR